MKTKNKKAITIQLLENNPKLSLRQIKREMAKRRLPISDATFYAAKRALNPIKRERSPKKGWSAPSVDSVLERENAKLRTIIAILLGE